MELSYELKFIPSDPGEHVSFYLGSASGEGLEDHSCKREANQVLICSVFFYHSTNNNSKILNKSPRLNSMSMSRHGNETCVPPSANHDAYTKEDR